MRAVSKIIVDWVAQQRSNEELPSDINTSELTTAAVAMTLAYNLTLPTGPVDRPEEWYLVNCFGGVEVKVGELNEYTVLNVTDTMNLTRSLWMTRYNILHRPTSEEALNLCYGLTQSENRMIPPVYQDAINKVPQGAYRRLLDQINVAMVSSTEAG